MRVRSFGRHCCPGAAVARQEARASRRLRAAISSDLEPPERRRTAAHAAPSAPTDLTRALSPALPQPDPARRRRRRPDGCRLRHRHRPARHASRSGGLFSGAGAADAPTAADRVGSSSDPRTAASTRLRSRWRRTSARGARRPPGRPQDPTDRAVRATRATAAATRHHHRLRWQPTEAGDETGDETVVQPAIKPRQPDGNPDRQRQSHRVTCEEGSACVKVEAEEEAKAPKHRRRPKREGCGESDEGATKAAAAEKAAAAAKVAAAAKAATAKAAQPIERPALGPKEHSACVPSRPPSRAPGCQAHRRRRAAAGRSAQSVLTSTDALTSTRRTTPSRARLPREPSLTRTPSPKERSAVVDELGSTTSV